MSTGPCDGTDARTRGGAAVLSYLRLALGGPEPSELLGATRARCG